MKKDIDMNCDEEREKLEKKEKELKEREEKLVQLEKQEDYEFENCTNLQKAYIKAAVIFTKTVVQGNPEHIAIKMKKCPIIKDFGVTSGGYGLWIKSLGHVDASIYFINLPRGIRLIETVTKTYKVEKDPE